jgi:predicted flap endonuclease-1-like 5' DNA nuclease
MPAFTTTEWAILFLVLLLGWLLGLISRSSGKWRRLYESERDARAEEQREHEAAIAAANTRIAELERARETSAVAKPRPAAAVAATPSPATLKLTSDDLTRIRGINASGERRLNAEGISRYRDITGLSAAEEAALEEHLGMDPGYIEQEEWRHQAALLQEGKIEEHRLRFG